MKYQLTAPSRFDRVACLCLHTHERFKRDGYLFRRCLTFGCGMLCQRPTFWTFLTTPFRRRPVQSGCSPGGGRA